MPPDSVSLEVAVVDFEVEPVEAEGLCEAERGFAVVGVDAVGGGLVEEGDNAKACDSG